MAHHKMIPSITGLVLCLAVALLSFLWSSQPATTQKRDTALTPVISQYSISDNLHMVNLEGFLRERFPLQSAAIAADHRLQLFCGSRLVNQVFVMPDRQILNISPSNPLTAKSNTEAVNLFTERFGDRGSVYFSLIPTASEIYRDLLPQYPHMLDQTAVINSVYGGGTNLSKQAAAQELTEDYGVLHGATPIDLHSALFANKGQKLYYDTDTSFTSLGTFTLYSSIMTAMGETHYVRDRFDIEYTAYGYYGDLFGRTLIRTGKGDSIDLYRFAAVSEQAPRVETVTKYMDAENSIHHDSIYFEEYLNRPRKTDFFLGEDFGLTEIETTAENAGNILVFSGSNTKPLSQFLSLHYKKITFINLSEVTEQQARSVDLSDYRTVLFLFSMDSYMSDNSIAAKLPLLFQQ